MKSRASLFASACAGMFVFGIVLAILGTIFGLPEMRDRLAVNLAQQGDIFLALFFGVFLSTILVGPVIDRFGNKAVLSVSAFLVAGALVLFSTAHSYAAAALAGFILGFGGGGLNTSTNTLVADLYSEDRGARLNILGTFFGFGALLIPLLAATITGVLSIPQILLAAALLSLVCGIVYVLLSFPPATEPTGFSLLASIRAASIPGVLLFASLLFFQSGNESSIGGWTSTYLGTIGAPPRTATWVLATYWAALMAGRVISAQLLKAMSKQSLVIASGIGSVIGCLVLRFSDGVGMMFAGAAIVGLSFAAIYPTTLAIAADRYQRQAGTIFGFLFAIGLIGGMSFPWALGHISQAMGVRSGMVLPVVGSLAIVAIAFVIKRAGATRATVES